MTREEAIKYAEDKFDKGLYRLELGYLNRGLYQIVAKEVDFMRVAISALKKPPVVHGRWIFGTTMNREWMKCSKCLVSQTPTGVFSYCPNCGARMDGDKDG